jgi:hypothetical protein
LTCRGSFGVSIHFLPYANVKQKLTSVGLFTFLLPKSSDGSTKGLRHGQIFEFLTRPQKASRPLQTLDANFNTLRDRLGRADKNVTAGKEAKKPEEKKVSSDKLVARHPTASIRPASAGSS